MESSRVQLWSSGASAVWPLIAALLLMGAQLYGATFTVTRTNNTGPGSLPVIINTANASPGANTIEFSVTGTIFLVSPLPLVTNSVTINGRSNIVISGSGVTNLFTFGAGTTNVLSALTIRDAAISGNGAAVSNAGTLIISGCVLTNNTATGAFGTPGHGGAIYNGGILTLVSCGVVSNKAERGGAIFSANTTTIVTSLFSGNESTNGPGGAIYSFGSLNIVDSLLKDNIAKNTASGGAIYSEMSLTLTNSLLSGNTAGWGGGIYSSGPLTISSLTISNNQALRAFGGGVYSSSNLTVNAATFVGNRANAENGQNGGGGGLSGGGGGGGGFGGGLFHTDAIALITNCTFSGNIAQGGNGGSPSGGLANGGRGGGSNAGAGGSAGISASGGGFGGGGGGGFNGFGGIGGFGGGSGGNNTLSGNGGSGFGGAIFVANASFVCVNSTISSNSSVFGTGASSGSGAGGGIYSYRDLGTGSTTLRNTIIAGNSAPTASPDLLGTNFTSVGFNLVGNNQGAISLSINDFQNEAANLGPLQDNGGSTFTHALLPGSLAIGGGTSVGAPATDQRGVFRPAGFVDIGAFQLITKITPTITWTTPADIYYGTALGSGHLNATCGVPGTFVFNPPAGTILNAGVAQTLSALFVPNDIINYASNSATVSLNVLKANQGIAFSPLPIHQFGDPPFLLSAVPSSGLPVAYSILSGPAFLVGNLVTLGASQGLVTIQASQSGNANYNAAANVVQSFYLGTPTFPVVAQQPLSVGAVPGDRIVFNVDATGAPLTYQWQFMGANLAGETNSTLTLQRASSGLSGPYTVLVSNPGGTVVSAIANLTVNVAAGTPVITTQPQGQTIQAGNVVNLSLAASGTGLTYQWHQGSTGNTNTPIAGAIAPNYSTPALNANVAYWCLVRNTAGLADSQTANISVQPQGAAANLGLGLVSAISIAGTPGANYRVDYATDGALTNWIVLTNFALPSTPYLFLDFGVSNAQRRFYRVVAP